MRTRIKVLNIIKHLDSKRLQMWIYVWIYIWISFEFEFKSIFEFTNVSNDDTNHVSVEQPDNETDDKSCDNYKVLKIYE